MTSRHLLGFSLALCAALAGCIARRDKSYEKLASGLMTLTVADFLRFKLTAFWGEPRPYEGYRRALFHLDEGLFLLWPMTLAWFIYDILGEQEDALRKVISTWVILVVALVVGYPEPFRGDVLVNALYPSMHLLAVVATIPTILYWAYCVHHTHKYPLEALILTRQGVTYPHGTVRRLRGVDLAVLWLWVGAAADLAGTWWLRDALRFWAAGRWVSIATYGVLAAYLGVELARSRRLAKTNAPRA